MERKIQTDLLLWRQSSHRKPLIVQGARLAKHSAYNGEVIPIEVKSSENVRSKSLQQFVSKYNPPYSIRFSTKNFGLENNIKSIPLYGAFCV